MRSIARRIVIGGLVALTAGCSGMQTGGKKITHGLRAADQTPVAPTDQAIMKANDVAAAAARDARAKARAKSFEQWAAGVYRDPGGKYIVNGDTPIVNRKQLKEFYDLSVAKEPTPRVELTMGTANGMDTAWNSTDKKNITYCVSPSFGSHRAQVLTDITAATGAWEQCADVKFIHVASEDANCTPSNGNVVFDVRPVNVSGEYFARAFFPNEPRAARNVLIDDSSFDPDQMPGDLKLDGILRHELGHTLGLRHEQTRPEAGKCFEDNNWRPLTAYDKFSVMHYPQCNGGTSWALKLTNSDKSGIACAYGPAPGFTIDTTICTPAASGGPSSGGQATTRAFTNQSVAADAEKPYGPFTVKAGTRFTATMKANGTAPGDPDLYVRFGATPNVASRTWSCRPYLDGPEESCALDVPASVTKAFVMVRGYSAGRYDLKVDFTTP